jgi:hypothetical protein
VHIFWQKRIREGDETTPWWFPSKTSGGSIREDRIVLPIPMGMHWSDEMPRILPAESQLPDFDKLGRVVVGGEKGLPQAGHGQDARGTRKKVADRPAVIRRNGLVFDIPQPGAPPAGAKILQEAKPTEKAPRPKRSCDPTLIAAARELRDRWVEQISANPALIEVRGKYLVSAGRQEGRLRLPPAAA